MGLLKMRILDLPRSPACSFSSFIKQLSPIKKIALFPHLRVPSCCPGACEQPRCLPFTLVPPEALGGRPWDVRLSRRNVCNGTAPLLPVPFKGVRLVSLVTRL